MVQGSFSDTKHSQMFFRIIISAFLCCESWWMVWGRKACVKGVFLKSTYLESYSEWEQSLSGCLQSQPQPASCCCCLFIVPSEFCASLHYWNSEIPLRAERIALTANHADGEAQWHWPAGIPGPAHATGLLWDRNVTENVTIIFLRKDVLWSTFKECLMEHILHGLEGFSQVRFSLWEEQDRTLILC